MFQISCLPSILTLVFILLTLGNSHSAVANHNAGIENNDTNSSKSISSNDLNIVTNLLVDGEYKNFGKSTRLNKYLKIELINRAQFENKRLLAVNFLSKNNSIKKKKGVLSIPTIEKVVKLIDINTDSDNRANFEYIGQIDALNQHLVFGQFWEISSYTMIDKTSGKQAQNFVGYPYLSPDKKYIVAVYANPYGNPNTDFELYRVQNKKIVPFMSAEFENWMPAINPRDIFWARDGYLYLAVTHSSVFWKENGDYNDKFQYIRIKVDL